MSKIIGSLLLLLISTGALASDLVKSAQNILSNGRIEGKLASGRPCTVDFSALESDSFAGAKPSIRVVLIPVDAVEQMLKVTYVEGSPRYKANKVSISDSTIVLKSTMKADDQYSGSTKTELTLSKHEVTVTEFRLLSNKSLTCRF